MKKSKIGHAYMRKINKMIFNDDKTVLIKCPDDMEGTVEIPYDVIEIADYAFNNCRYIEYIRLNDVKKIGMGAFKNCTSLKGVFQTKCLERIEDIAFYNCLSLKFFSVPKSLCSIGEYVFANCILDKSVRGIINNAEIQVASTAFINDTSGNVKIDTLNKRVSENKNVEIEVNSPTEERVPLVKLNIYKNCFCIKNHIIENCRAEVVSISDGQKFIMNVQYCKTCGKYMIDERSFKNYISKGMIPALKIVDNRPVEMTVSGIAFKENSVLSLYGYNVQEGKLKDNERRKILVFILENGIADKSEIKQLLNQFIEINGKQSRNKSAAIKWNEDLMFVNDYKINSQRNVKLSVGRIITHKEKIK